MWTTTDTTAALARARNESIPLLEAKGGASSNGATSGIATSLEALAAVIPAGIVATYTLATVPMRQFALADGVRERAQAQADLVTAKLTSAEIAQHLEGLPQESGAWFGVRIGFLALTALVVLITSYRAAASGNRDSSKRRKIMWAEPSAALFAFVGWALAGPGTPLATKLDTDSLGIWTTAIAAGALLVLLALGESVLTKEAKRAKTPGR